MTRNILALVAAKTLSETPIPADSVLRIVNGLIDESTQKLTLPALLDELRAAKLPEFASLRKEIQGMRRNDALAIHGKETPGAILEDLPASISKGWQPPRIPVGADLTAEVLLRDIRLIETRGANFTKIHQNLEWKLRQRAECAPELSNQELWDALSAVSASGLDLSVSEEIEKKNSQLQSGSAARIETALTTGEINVLEKEDIAPFELRLSDLLNENTEVIDTHVLDLLLCWPNPTFCGAISDLSLTPDQQDRAALILHARFGQPMMESWAQWCQWLKHQKTPKRSSQFHSPSLEEAATILIPWGIQKELSPESISSLQTVFTPSLVFDFLTRHRPQISEDEKAYFSTELTENDEVIPVAEILPNETADHSVTDNVTESIPTQEPTSAYLEATPAPKSIPSKRKPIEEPVRTSFWESHLQPALTENWYVFAGIAMVLVGATLLAYYTWEKAWWVRYTIMPTLLATFTCTLAWIGNWVLGKGEEFRSISSMLYGAAVGLLPVNFMVIPLLAADQSVPNNGFLALLLGSVYLILFGRACKRWCDMISPEISLPTALPVICMNLLLFLPPLIAPIFDENNVPAFVIGAGFHIAIIWIAYSLKQIFASESTNFKALFRFFIGCQLLTLVETFIWSHTLLERVPSASNYGQLVIFVGWLAWQVELHIRRGSERYHVESFVGFACIFMGILLAAPDPALRIAAFITSGAAWIHQAFMRKEPIHHWIGLTLLVLAGVSIGSLDSFPKPFLPVVGLVMGGLLGIGRQISERKDWTHLYSACAGTQMTVMLMTAVVAGLTQNYYQTNPIYTALILTVIAFHMIYAGLKDERVRWIHTAMAIMAVSLPFFGFADMIGRTIHGNTMVFGLALLSFAWFGLLKVLPRPLLLQARSTVISMYGSLAVVAMAIRVILEQGIAGERTWLLNFMDYSGPVFMSIALVFCVIHSRSLVPSFMAFIILVILLPELKEHVRGTVIDDLWGSGIGSSLCSLGLILLSFRLRALEQLQELSAGDDFQPGRPFPLLRHDYTLFTWPLLATAAFLVIKINSLNLLFNIEMMQTSLLPGLAICVSAISWTLLAVYHAYHKSAANVVRLGATVWAAGLLLLFRSNPIQVHWCWAVLTAGLSFEALLLLYQSRRLANYSFTESLLVKPTRESLNIGIWIATQIVLGAFIFSEITTPLQLLAGYICYRLIQQARNEEHSLQGVALYALLWQLTASFLLAPGTSLIDSMNLHLATQITLWLNLSILLITVVIKSLRSQETSLSNENPFFGTLNRLAIHLSTVVSIFILGAMLSPQFFSMEGIWVPVLSMLMIGGVLTRSSLNFTLATLFIYARITIDPALSYTFATTSIQLITPYNLAWLGILMLVVLHLFQQFRSYWINLPLVGTHAELSRYSQSPQWMEFSALIITTIAAVHHNFQTAHSLSPDQLPTSYIATIAFGFAAWRQGYRALIPLGAISLLFANFQAIRIYANTPMAEYSLTLIHQAWLALLTTMGILSLIMKWRPMKVLEAPFQHTVLFAGTTLLLTIPIHYLANIGIATTPSSHLLFNALAACASLLLFKLTQDEESETSSVSNAMIRWAIAIAAWSFAFLIPVLRQPHFSLIAVMVPTFIYLAKIELRKNSEKQPSPIDQLFLWASLIIPLCFWLTPDIFSIALFPEMKMASMYQHWNAPLLTLIGITILRTNSWSPNSGNINLGFIISSIGLFYCMTWIPDLNPTLHPWVASWTAIMLGHALLAVLNLSQGTRDTLETFFGVAKESVTQVLRNWSIILASLAHAASLFAIRDFTTLDETSVAPLVFGLATIALHAGYHCGSKPIMIIGGLQLAFVLHADFIITSWIPKEMIIWVILSLWFLLLCLERTRFVSKDFVRKAVAPAYLISTLHVFYHGSTSTEGWWASLTGFFLLSATPSDEDDNSDIIEHILGNVLWVLPLSLCFFGALARDLTYPEAILTTAFATTGIALFIHMVQLTSFTKDHICNRLILTSIQRIEKAADFIPFVIGIISLGSCMLMQLTHYNFAFSTTGLWLLLANQATIAWLCYRFISRIDNSAPSFFMQVATAAFFIAIRHHLMLTSNFWNHHYDVWAMLCISYCIAGIKPMLEQRSQSAHRTILATIILLPAVACSWVMFHDLGTNTALLVVGLYSLKFSYLGRDDRESPYNAVAIFGFTAFLLIAFWSKFEIRYAHAYVLPVGIAILIMLHVFKDRMETIIRNQIRFVTLAAMIGTTGYYALIDHELEITFNLLMIGVCIVSMLLGSALRIRLYLTIGMSGLLVDLASILYKVTMHMERDNRMTVIGSLVLLVGSALVWGAIYYKTHREEIAASLEGLRQKFGRWE